jgi:hypothetical protein
MRRKILMGVLAIALPAGTLLATQTVALAKKPPPNPVSCTGFSGTVTFGTPISANGTPTHSAKSLATAVSGGTFTCSGGVAPNTGGAGNDGGGLNIKGGKNDKNASYSKASCKTSPSDASVCDKYITGSRSEFVATGTNGSLAKSIKKINFSIAGGTVQFKAVSAGSSNACLAAGDVGFDISGTVTKGNFATATATITACLNHDTGPGTTNSFGADLFSPTASIVTADIDPSVSVATL